MLLAIIILTGRSKGLAFVSTFIFMKYGRFLLQKARLLYILSIALVSFLSGLSRLRQYISFSSSGREVLWIGSFTLMRICFPFGSGFGTFASHISGKYRSEVYNFINIWEFWKSDGSATAILGDAGYPYYIAQFGIFGIFLFGLGIWRILKLWHEGKGDSQDYVSSGDLLLIYIAISLTSESILLNNGYEIGTILAILSKADEINKK